MNEGSAERAPRKPAWGITLLILAQIGGCALPSGTDRTSSTEAAAVTIETNAFPGIDWPVATPPDVGMDVVLLDQARDYALSGGGSGLVVRYGKRVYAWGDLAARYELKSATKSIGSALL